MLRLPFLVDDYFVPNGCFGDATCQGGVIEINSRVCSSPRPASAQGVCRRYTYDPLAEGEPGFQGYLGILFQDAVSGSSDIGLVPPVSIEPGAKRVVFWAYLGSGSVMVHFRAGGANNWEGHNDQSLPYWDTFGVPLSVMLTTEPTQFEIDLSTTTYDKVVSPFGWAIVGPTEPVELYIDDVRWE
jgi:hypothetical protein